MLNFLCSGIGFYYSYYFWGLILIPGIIFGSIAQIKVQNAYTTNSAVYSELGISSHDAAVRLLESKGLSNIQINRISGQLTDNYNPRNKTVNLSDGNYDSTSLSALGVMAHEVGHAVQHKERYFPLVLRNILIPINNIISPMVWIVLILGLFLDIAYTVSGIGQILIFVGIGIFGLSTIISLVTLPVEYNASKRAMEMLLENGIITENETRQVKQVLDAAALTYVAGMVMSLLSLLRVIFVVVGSRKRK